MQHRTTAISRHLLLVGTLFAASRTPIHAQASAGLQAAVAQAGGRVIVTLRSTRTGGSAALMAPGSPPVAPEEQQQIAAHLQADLAVPVLKTLPATAMLVTTVQPAQLATLLADPNVAAVEPDRVWFLADVDVPVTADRWAAYRRTPKADTTPWGVAQVTAPTVWANGNKGDGIKVGVLDSGGDASHPDLSYAGGYDAVNQNTINWNDDVASCNGHGTHIAGTIAAKDDGIGIVGVAPHVQLYAMKVFQDVSGSCGAYTSSQIAGINWAVSQGIRLVNISIAGSSSAAYDAAIQAAAASGTYVFAAAGNNGGAVTYPGSSAYAFGIGALDDTNTRASFSDFGPELDFSAPGVTIYSTMPGGAYGYKSGTSMATPHALGVAALILSSNPSLSFDQLRQKLIDGALDLETAGFDNNTGYGLVRAANSIAGGGSPPAITLTVTPLSRRVSVQQAAAAPGDNASVTLSGTGASSATWTATKRKSWTTLTTASGTGSGTVTWSRNSAGLGIGAWVDTITVTATGATGSPRMIIDTLNITAPPPAVTLALSPASRRVSVTQGGAAVGDNASVTLSGTGAGTATWTATKRKSWTTLTTSTGTGSGTVAWTRATSALAVGTYVDTITVTSTGATGSPSTVIDSIVVTAAPLPLTLSVTPASRNVSVQVGTAAPGDAATISFTGTGAASAVWTAAKRKSWTTLTSVGGTGNGTVTWTRNTSGLAAGTYVDTISVTAAGALASPAVVYDTLVLTAAVQPLTLALAPGSRRATILQGDPAPADSVTVTITGTGASTAVWWGSHRRAYTTITSGNGSGGGVGSGYLTWTRNSSGLAPGVYVDTLGVAVAGGSGLTAVVLDTFTVTASSAPLAVAITPGSRSISVQQGAGAADGSATVTITGTGASSTVWWGGHRQPWTTITSGNGSGGGVGSGMLTWSRNTIGLAVGLHVDTLSVALAGGSGLTAVLYDSITVTAALSPLQLAVAPASRRVTVQAGVAAPSDNAAVTLSGTGASGAAWTASKRKSWTTLTSSAGTGSGSVAWSRDASGLAAGTYVDTITVAAVGAVGSPGTIIDTLVITAATQPLVLAVAPGARSTSVVQGGLAPGDNATVTLSGTGSASATWTASKRKSWTVLTTASGSGSGTVAWSRNTSALAVGVYVDTISVTAAGATGSPTVVFDTVRVTAAPIPVTVALSPGSRSATIVQGDAAPGASATITLAGDNAAATQWTATARKSWTVIPVATGIGSGTLSWSRSSAALAAGTYVDTITVAVNSGSTARVIDTLVVQPVTSVATTPRGKKFRLLMSGSAASSIAPVQDSAQVQGQVPLGASDVWIASAQANWLQVTLASGHLNDWIHWQRLPSVVGVGIHVDTIHVALQSAPAVEAILIDTLEVVAVAAPAPSAAVEDLFRPGVISDDQRTLLDHEGNNNGRYDLGDFLAWVDHNHIRLSAAVMTRVQGLINAQAASAVARPRASGGNQSPSP